jgi:hypothetical protein
MALNHQEGRGLSTAEADIYNNEEKPSYEDLEGQNHEPRRMSRIDKPAVVSDSDSSMSIGALIEMEKDNAIKYRTCSWQKVRFSPSETRHT